MTFELLGRITKPTDGMLTKATEHEKHGERVNRLDNHSIKTNLNLVMILGQILQIL